MDFVVFIIIVVIVGLGRLIQAIAENQKKNSGERPRAPGREEDRGSAYSASPNDIREFLSDLSNQAQRREPAPQPRPQARPQAPAAPAFKPEAAQSLKPLHVDVAPVQVADTAQSDSMPSGPVPMQAAAPLQKARRTKQTKKQGPKRQQQTVTAQARRRLKTESRPISAPTTGLPTGVSLRGGNLRQAVIWSEILGRPVGMRRRGGQRPPSARR